MDASDAGKSSEKCQTDIAEDNTSMNVSESHTSTVTSVSAMSSDITDEELSWGKASKRPRLVWTPQLHKTFVDAVTSVGLENARPRTIMEIMNVKGLTQANVAAHLQKYRLSLGRLQTSFNEGDGSSGFLHIKMGRMKRDEISDAQPMFDKMPVRTNEDSCSKQRSYNPLGWNSINDMKMVRELEEVELEMAQNQFLSNKILEVQEENTIMFSKPELGEVGDEDRLMQSLTQKQLKDSIPIPERGSDQGVSEEKEIMFSKELTPTDVGKLNRMVVPKLHAEKYFPELWEKGLLLSFEDPVGKLWLFRYTYWNNSQTYVLTRGWSRFVKENHLHAGDTLTFGRGVGDRRKNKLFISWRRRPDTGSVGIGAETPLITNPELPHTLVSDNSIASPLLNLNLSLQTPLRPALLPAVVAQDTGSHDSQPLSCDLHPLEPAQGFYGKMVDDALLFCALFPPDHEFEKDSLIQLWIADGIFVDEPMERIADLFFENCLTRRFFKFSRTNVVTGKAMYKFNVESSLLTTLMSRGSHVAGIEGSSNLDDISPEVSHLSVRCHNMKDSTAFCGFKNIEQLRTLVFLQGSESSFKQISRNFFLPLRLLRVLDLSKTRLMELPSSIGNMRCLCYLDLSDTLIKRLPEVIDRLENLQTLKLRGCSNLSTLPKGMRKLVNLRHLDFDVLRQLWSMPPGMGALTNIQTLSAFLVGAEEGCGIRQLKNMNNLSGSFCISRLEIVAKDEAEEACLSNKSKLEKLELHWSDSQLEDALSYGEVISSLQPNTSVLELRISCYGGLQLPSWICDPAFSKLVSVTLFKCQNCVFLSSLGQLPSLKLLNIVDFHKLKVIDQNFYGGSGLAVHIAFPKLERLTFENMFSLEEWSGIRIFDFPHLLKLTVKNCPKLHSLSSRSCLHSLEYLEISYCPELAACPDIRVPGRLETFIIKDCPLISARFLNDGGHDWLKVEHIPRVWIDNQEISFGQRFSQEQP